MIFLGRRDHNSSESDSQKKISFEKKELQKK